MNSPELVSEEAALTGEEVEQIFRACGAKALLVGGQALAAWVVYYGITPVGILSRSVTSDADFLGSGTVADELQRALGSPWIVRHGTLDDVTGQVAKVYAATADGIKQIDFLSSVVGLDTSKIRERATIMEFADGASIAVLHPLDVLESRLRNLDTLPAKRNEKGAAQARLAVSVVRAYVQDLAVTGINRREAREAREAIKRVERLALDSRLVAVAVTFEIDVLAALPLEHLRSTQFVEKQWPRVVARLEQKKARFAKLQGRRAGLRRGKEGPAK